MEYEVRLSNPGSEKIRVIKEIRRLTNTGLKEAKEIVDSRGLIASGLNGDEAAAIVARLEAQGAEVALEPSWQTSTLTYDPARAADQELIRVSQRESVVGLRTQPFGSPGSLAIEEHATIEQANARVASLLAGRVAVESEREAYLAVTTRNDDLEAKIAAAPDDDGPRLVYGDWLVDHHDIRGDRLIQAVHGEPAPDHNRIMLGHLDRFCTTHRWDRGLLTKVDVPYTPSISTVDLEELLGSMPALTLRQLGTTSSLADSLAHAEWPALLDEVHLIHDHWGRHREYRAPQAIARRVKTLVIDGFGPISIGSLHSERLEELRVAGFFEHEQDYADFLADSTLPALRRLSVVASMWDDLAPAPNSVRPAFFELDAPHLESLRINAALDLEALAQCCLLKPADRLELADVESHHVPYLVDIRSDIKVRQAVVLPAEPLSRTTQATLENAGWSIEWPSQSSD